MKKQREGRDASAGYKLSLLHWLDSMLLNRMLRPLDIRKGQMAVLSDVLKKDGIVQNELNSLQGTDRSATARTLRILEDVGLVNRYEDQNNRRRKLVFATPKAKGMSDQLFETLGENNRILFHGFTEEEKDNCLDYLDRMIANARESLEGE